MSEFLCFFGGCRPAFEVNAWLDGLTALATTAAVVIAWYQIDSARHEVAVRATFAAIDFEATSKEWEEQTRKLTEFAAAHKFDGQAIAQALATDFAAGRAGDNYVVANAVLTRREYMALLLRSGGGDLRTYLLWDAQRLINQWRWLRDLVLRFRRDSNNPNLYANFEWLVERAQGVEVK